MRVHHWIKNLLIIAPAFFAIHLNNQFLLEKVLIGFVAFSCLTSAVYLANDLMDREKDRVHPKKRNRPLASGLMSVSEAGVLITCLGIIGLGLAWWLSATVFSLFVLYGVLNSVYSRWIKHIPIIDLLTVTSFYVLRVYIGGEIASVHVSEWLILSTFFLALFLVTIKRRQELLLGQETRKVLQEYNKEFLDMLIMLSATSAILFYAFYATTKPSGFIWSMLFVVYGLLRYAYMVLVNNHGEEPERLIISDKGILSGLLAWFLFMAFFFYFH
jgi:decaprenyl-phosphate phosphoribosyltransferase